MVCVSLPLPRPLRAKIVVSLVRFIKKQIPFFPLSIATLVSSGWKVMRDLHVGTRSFSLWVGPGEGAGIL
jgi:hypothetical protein